MKGKRLLFVDNRVEYFRSHRLPWAEAARQAGWEVHVTTLTAGDPSSIREEGFRYHPIAKTRFEGNPVQEAVIVKRLYDLYRQLQPDLVHNITLRSVLYSGLVARFTQPPAIVNGVTGLGYMFIDRSLKARLVRRVFCTVLPLALNHPNSCTVFQNADDRNDLVAEGISFGRTTIVRGSGVNMEKFTFAPESEGPPIVIFPSRMVRHKGVHEFVRAARYLREKGDRARFVLVGDTDPDNPVAVSREQLEAWQEEGVVEWWGHRNDMPAVFAQAHMVCLPSYREGLPKVLLEAASSGRAIVATDVPGCREIVADGKSGLTVPVRDARALAHGIRKLLQNPDKRVAMGRAGRNRVDQHFAVERIVQANVDIYRRLICS